MKFFPGTTNLFDDMLDDMFTSPFFSNRSDMVMKTDITEKDGYYVGRHILLQKKCSLF